METRMGMILLQSTFGKGEREGDRKGGSLSHCYFVWCRFLHALEESACSEEEPDEGTFM